MPSTRRVFGLLAGVCFFSVNAQVALEPDGPSAGLALFAALAFFPAIGGCASSSALPCRDYPSCDEHTAPSDSGLTLGPGSREDAAAEGDSSLFGSDAAVEPRADAGSPSPDAADPTSD
jgi:hypothetical protein